VIPVTDEAQARRFPFVNLTFIVINILVFIYQLTLSEDELQRFFLEYGVVPAELTGWLDDPQGVQAPLSLITSAFLHGGWLHIAGNMLYLWVFGDNIEDSLGHLPYAVFYLMGAIGAAALQVAITPDETIPMVGASGAIAAVLGGYLVLHPTAMVGVLIPWLWFLGALPLPAVLLIGFWFLLQLFAGVATLGTETIGGIAYWAHIGGFAAGFVIILALRPLIPRRPAARARKRRPERMW
jgi:membrane associated rhomboid family serine protease